MQVQFRTEPHLITSFRPVRGVSFISPLARERCKSKGMQGKRIITWWVSGSPSFLMDQIDEFKEGPWSRWRPTILLSWKMKPRKKNKTTTSICYHHYDNYYTERNRFRPFSFCFVFSNRFFFGLHTLHLYVKRISKDAGWFWIWSCIIVSDKVIRDLLIKSSPTLTIQKLIPKSRLPRFSFCFFLRLRGGSISDFSTLATIDWATTIPSVRDDENELRESTNRESWFVDSFL